MSIHEFKILNILFTKHIKSFINGEICIYIFLNTFSKFCQSVN